MRGRREKVIQKWSRKFRDRPNTRLYILPRLFPIKDVIELREKAGNALRSKSKNVVVR